MNYLTHIHTLLIINYIINYVTIMIAIILFTLNGSLLVKDGERFRCGDLDTMFL